MFIYTYIHMMHTHAHTHAHTRTHARTHIHIISYKYIHR